MKKKENIVRYTAEELAVMCERGEDRTDWAKVKAMTEDELEASIAADSDGVHEELDWTQGFVGLPPGKKHINIRVDADVLDWFRSKGKGYQTYMNSVLRAFVAKQGAGQASNRL
ncbi:MAG: BrnA antitoxin family protein [Nitrospirae bacterium]|nr:BrnA antitoxin family protein [Nitrospirota bacterium]